MNDISFDKTLLGNIATHGWAPVSVFGGWTEEDSPSLVYTVGLYKNYGHPELLISGIPTRVSLDILAPVVERIKLGESFVHGQMDTWALNGCPICFAAIPQKLVSSHMGKSELAYDLPPPALQIYWPDSSGNFPWAPGYSVGSQKQGRFGDEPDLIQFDMAMPSAQGFQYA